VKLRIPNGPSAQAFCLINRLHGLTPYERMALNAVWLINGLEAKPIGAAVVAHMVGCTILTAKKLLSSLSRKGYLSTTGKKFRPGANSVATRQITSKAGLPKWGMSGHRSAAKSAEKKPVTRQPPEIETGDRSFLPTGDRAFPLSYIRVGGPDGPPTHEEGGINQTVSAAYRDGSEPDGETIQISDFVAQMRREGSELMEASQ